MKEKKCNPYRALSWAFGIGLVLCVLQKCTFENMIKKECSPIIYKYETTLHADSLWRDSIIKGELDMAQLLNRVDSISKVSSDISNRYQEDINLMIYKTTQWLSFWLTVMTVIAGIIFVFQFFDKRRFDTELQKIKDNFDDYKKNTKGELGQRVTEYTDSANMRIDNKIRSSNEELDKLKNRVEKYDMEIRISTLVTCISTFPEPSMFGTGTNKQKSLKYYLHNLYFEYEQYVKFFKEEKTDKELDKEYSRTSIIRLSVVLISVKYIVIRTQNTFPDYHQNITFYSLLKRINNAQKKIVANEATQESLIPDIDAITKLFGKMVKDI